MYGIGEVKTSLSNTDHTQLNCGMGLYDKNKVYYMNDVDGKVIVDGKRCTVLSKEGYENTAVLTLGDKKYNVVKMPDGKYWLAEELDWLADGITLITSGNATYSIPAACYCNYVNTGLGLLYNKHAIALLGSILPVGWRISTENDWLNLLTSIGGNDSTHIAKLKSSKLSSAGHWVTPGTDVYGFDLRCTGYRTTAGGFITDRYSFYTSTKVNDNYRRGTIQNSSSCTFDAFEYPFYCVRLVKD